MSRSLTVPEIINCARVVCGSWKALAKRLKVKYQTVQHYVINDSIPANKVLKLSEITGIPPEKIKPEVFSGWKK